jgi:hypothetical protein
VRGGEGGKITKSEVNPYHYVADLSYRIQYVTL